jgi:hypothetical protein
MDSIATELDNQANYSEPTNSLSNDQSDDTWQNNSFVRKHDPTGRVLLFYIASESQDGIRIARQEPVDGVRLIVSGGWDSNNDLPSGNSNLRGSDAPAKTSANNVDESYNQQKVDGRYNNEVSLGYWLYYNSDRKRSVIATQDVNYLGSIDGESINIGVWSGVDSDNGIATYMSIYQLNEKFWTTPQDDFSTYLKCSLNEHQSASLGWEYITAESSTFSQNYQWYPDPDGSNYQDLGTGFGRFGTINPDTNDDTFFFRYPIIFKSPGHNIPVQYLKTTLPNDPVDGAAHEDIVTHNTTDYIIMNKKGDGVESGNVSGSVISLGARRT